jgi:hypothetical protein
MNIHTEADIMAKKKTIKNVTVRTLPNGYALTIGGHEYMYFSEETLTAGIFDHLLLGNKKDSDINLSANLIEAAATWQTIGEAVKANALLIRENKALKKRNSELGRINNKLLLENDRLQEEYSNLKTVIQNMSEINILEKGKNNKNIK